MRTSPLRIPAAVASSAFAGVLLAGCAYHAPAPFDAPQSLGGVEIDAATLNAGQRAYGYYCRACHGDAGDGRGPAAAGLQTPPRDFRVATFKFTGTPEGYLPHDEDILRVVRSGLHGTAMLRWSVPEPMLGAIVHYVKAFSPPGQGFRDPDADRTARLVPGEDPWAGRAAEAVRRGEAVYHGKAGCPSCHPAYVTLEEVNSHRAAFGSTPLGRRDRAWLPEPKASDTYLVPLPGDATCATDSDCAAETEACHFGRCESKHVILPPDFTVNELRISRTPAEAWRIIASGVPGTAMPTWAGALPDEDVWAMAHYVDHLRRLQGTAEAVRMKQRVRADGASAPGPS
jgi:mono/diheme cytochrome c family protein